MEELLISIFVKKYSDGTGTRTVGLELVRLCLPLEFILTGWFCSDHEKKSIMKKNLSCRKEPS